MKLVNSFIWIIILVLFSTIVIAPPSTVNIRGTVFHNGGAYATGGFPVTANNTNTTDFVYSRTNGQASPQIDASYADTISGSAGDVLIVFAWNLTHYGTNTSIITTPTTRTNIILNTTRPSEINLSINYPNNNSKFNISSLFNLNATLLALGGINAENCTATLSIDSNEIVLYNDQASHELGNITLGNSKSTYWNLTGNLTGSTNLSVIAVCDSDGLRLDKQQEKFLYNVTIVDEVPPKITLIYNSNNTKLKQSGLDILFVYNVSDGSTINNCSLVINNVINKTNNSITKNSNLNFTTPLGNSQYEWYVNCTDEYDNIGYSGFFSLNITQNYIPSISNMQVTTPIDLNAGTSRIIHCNATITDNNGIGDINNLNSTFFSSSVQSNSPNDNNNHYTNSTCQIISSDTYSAQYSCSHNIEYYSNPGNWNCNISVLDNSSTFNSSNISTTVSELLAVDISPSIIDYGSLESGSNSIADVSINITNYGNTIFNITVQGYAQTIGDGFSMNCSNGNIDIAYEKYSIYAGTAYTSMIDLASSPSLIGNFTLPARTNDTTYKNDKNYTYWKMGIPLAMKGSCSGYVVFQAVN